MSTEPEPALLDVDAAAAVLGVGPEQVAAMVEEGLLRPAAGTAEPRFDAREVHALNQLGG